MNRVLIICSNFPPVRNGGTIRCEKLAKYLPEYDWETIVLTRAISKNNKLDYSLNLNHCKVYRTKKYDIASTYLSLKNKIDFLFKKHSLKRSSIINNDLSGALDNPPKKKRRISEYFLIPDADILWAIGSLVKSLIVVNNEKPTVIFTSGPMHSSHIIGLFLKKCTKLKWVVEFRDPWTMNPFLLERPHKLLTIIDDYLEKIVLKNADRINVTSQEYKKQFLAKYKYMEDEKFVFIPNGYDPEDFENINKKMNLRFTIVHTGNFYLQRSSSIFIESVIHLFKTGEIFPNNLLIKFIGLLDKKGEELIANSEFSDNFEMTGQISHMESIKAISNADLLLLIPGPGEGTMPGKFYEYLATSIPIFCIANEGPTKELIEKYHLGTVASDKDIYEIASKLNQLIKNIVQKKFTYPDVEELKIKYNRRDIALQMSNIFNNVL